eukprot:6183884-Pleurochrysis_carterae.AAC.2
MPPGVLRPASCPRARPNYSGWHKNNVNKPRVASRLSLASRHIDDIDYHATQRYSKSKQVRLY